MITKKAGVSWEKGVTRDIPTFQRSEILSQKCEFRLRHSKCRSKFNTLVVLNLDLLLESLNLNFHFQPKFSPCKNAGVPVVGTELSDRSAFDKQGDVGTRKILGTLNN